ncbi:MAG TPA: hypothetical protein DDY32_01955 [Desulfobulbaceae bacterium]|nr:hypothetical protein [Desulfobulbaceae bacterium]
MMPRRTLHWLLGIGLFLVSACGSQEQAKNGDERDFNPEILRDNKLMQAFVAAHPGKEVLKYAQADLSGDGRDDLVVIYRETKDRNRMCIIRTEGDHSIESNSVPAPVSDQTIRFKDIDNKAPLEFIAQGRKGAVVGYAIFRLEDGVLVDLFGEGFENCC